MTQSRIDHEFTMPNMAKDFLVDDGNIQLATNQQEYDKSDMQKLQAELGFSSLSAKKQTGNSISSIKKFCKPQAPKYFTDKQYIQPNTVAYAQLYRPRSKDFINVMDEWTQLEQSEKASKIVVVKSQHASAVDVAVQAGT